MPTNPEDPMIQFRDDHSLPAPHSGDGAGTAILGLGRAGVHIIDQLVLEKCGPRHLLAIDTDAQDIRASVAPHKHLLGRTSLRGLGTGGDPALAAQLAREDTPALTPLLTGLHTAILVAGLGGGTGTGATPALARLLRDQGTRVFALVFTPFPFEGERVLRARRGLHDLATTCPATAVFSASHLLHLPEAGRDIREAFRHANLLAARAASALLRLLDPTGTASLSETELAALLGTPTTENAWIAHGSASGHDRIDRVVGQILASPFLHTGTAWQHAHSATLTVTGGHDMPIAETQDLLIRLKQEIPVELKFRLTAHVDPRHEGSLSATLLLTASPSLSTTTAPAPTPAPESLPVRPTAATSAAPAPNLVTPADELPLDPPAPRPTRRKSPSPQRYFARQEELALDQKINRGRFEKSSPTIIDGQDLDIPTFMRLGLQIKV